jgi:3-dehydroquinate dehydratase-2
VTSVLVVDGPDLDLLGTRKPEVDGHVADRRGEDVPVRVRPAGPGVGVPAVRPRVALHDAIEGAELPVIECHISNVHEREDLRHHSSIPPVARGAVVGFGVLGHTLAVNGLDELSQEGSQA